jgi:uncharacterized protein YaiL (DUF2058 family)
MPHQEIIKFEEERKMQYVTTAERIGMHRGETAILLRQMEARFGTVPQWVTDKVKKADISKVQDWSIRFLSANSPEEVLREKKPKVRYVSDAERTGMHRGSSKILLRLMEARFGTLPQWAADKIKNADIAAIEDWSIRVLSANSPEELLKADGN